MSVCIGVYDHYIDEQGFDSQIFNEPGTLVLNGKTITHEQKKIIRLTDIFGESFKFFV